MCEVKKFEHRIVCFETYILEEESINLYLN